MEVTCSFLATSKSANTDEYYKAMRTLPTERPFSLLRLGTILAHSFFKFDYGESTRTSKQSTQIPHATSEAVGGGQPNGIWKSISLADLFPHCSINPSALQLQHAPNLFLSLCQFFRPRGDVADVRDLLLTSVGEAIPDGALSTQPAKVNSRS